MTITFVEKQKVEKFISVDSVKNEIFENLREKTQDQMGVYLKDKYSSKYILTKIADGVYLLDCYSEVFTIINNN